MSTQQTVDVAGTLSDGIRSAVIDHVLTEPRAVRLLAVGLDVPETSVQRMLTAPAWDLDLAIDAAQVLGLAIAVTTAPVDSI